ncbi:MAG: septum formation initiator family protein [Lachnospiraceae bacterium]|nr:septum formation initiator family protein [Lachnospiraceae bacterium]MBO7363038.1 septum formation initiator family protein [Lachnospiraceae bacterium]MBO7531307.1 septum formation initiator family protein [Lachnospiraceae bacterium]MBP5252733.1 septum formation initiator family protein [Lachnospiraceae bacterium]MBP5471247.1 septum formation initiator family protein [Lachnospiraceae bacterium]
MAAKERSGNRTMTAMEKRRRRSGASGYILFAVIVSLISLVVLVQIRDVKQRLSVYEQQDQALDEQIAAQLERTEELNELEKYVQTKAYAEEQAHEKLGLVNEGEIIFKLEDN